MYYSPGRKFNSNWSVIQLLKGFGLIVIRNRIFLFLKITVLCFTVSACVTPRSLQKARVHGLAHHYPVRIADHKKDERVSFQTQVLYNRQRETRFNTGTHSQVDEYGRFVFYPLPDGKTFRADTSLNKYDFTGNNLFWSAPEAELKAYIDFLLSNHSSFFFGGGIGSIGNHYYWGTKFGISFFWEFNSWAFTLENNINIYEKRFDVDYIEGKQDIQFLNRQSKHFYLDPAMLLTLNSRMPEWPLNVFFRIGAGSASLFDLRLDDNNLSHKNSYSLVSLGFYQNIAQRRRINMGFNLYQYSALNNRDNYVFETFIQYDIALE